MQISDAIQNRRSIRKYKQGVSIPDEHMKKILTAAMMAPSACNTRPWEFIVLKSEESKAKALQAHPYAKHLAQASAGILVCARPEAQEGIAEGYFPQDCGAAIENILLQSLALEYGTCWCGIYPREERIQAFRDTFQLSAIPFALVVIGVADETPAAKGFYDESKVTVL
ncbi:nitroreductase family protein [Ructibacterium gallinarum]|uniref:Nitroreductase family protein n=1 Tax=Ructibacterium gallinarum TaxID=2779355 RepID=A0A9D5M0X1_9FIRM|nr:nitroreductase family protein [Ructibacterium gallinarum]MBE5040597.1 nitroreductase family protein [Ructibacterium gallinarum]